MHDPAAHHSANATEPDRRHRIWSVARFGRTCIQRRLSRDTGDCTEPRTSKFHNSGTTKDLNAPLRNFGRCLQKLSTVTTVPCRIYLNATKGSKGFSQSYVGPVC